MKITQRKRNKEIIYIQLNDLAFLNSTDENIPASIYLKAFGQGNRQINDDNRFKYLEFTEPEEVKYLKSLDFILNYNEFNNLSAEDIEKIEMKIVSKLNDIAKKYNSLDAEGRRKNAELVSQHEKLKYLLDNLEMIYLKKVNGDDILLPIVYKKK
ncbi:MAG: hypothetical protein PHT75_04545 [Bacilli bacterium]|nr:hypothetical protein [Bacilli bacterium]MDD3305361.1 hypothetical protein [Bacilli bacterium]MDD4054052.1 hypothetical protein [Bacilli bacterium]MDD4411816.1 hypothetical protein [Bacilli bacterium]